ncbi:hypothetical protein PIB30_013352 [Stylosanthes scabra]|uniref:Uncharacterized protein n=1 Tax=Stylosanthes scabra TaxID=79078 RepID=A0ABU6U7A3_9FABA|nr:hypothetical protein [Stylosanthes scabra]
MAVDTTVNNLVLKELVELAVTRPTAQIPFYRYGSGVCSQQLAVKRTRGTCCHQAHCSNIRDHLVNSCRRDLTLASRGVRIAVTGLTPFHPIQSYGGLVAKVICTFHPTTETLWDSIRYLKS